MLQGLLLGFSLSFLVGPLMFAIVEAGISQGFRAGVAVAAGFWVSDILFMLMASFGIQSMSALTSWPGFRLWMGIAGGLLLILFGVGSMWKARYAKSEQARVVAQRPLYSWWLRGFLLNTINPGTLFFWLGIVSAVVIPSGWGPSQNLRFFGSMLFSLVLTDTLKAWGAKALRRFLTPEHTRKAQWGIGLLLLFFGVFFAARALFAR